MPPPPRTGSDVLRQAIARLRAAGVEEPARDARLLLARAMDIPAERLTLHISEPVTATVEMALKPLVEARAARQPMAQILGRRLFMAHEFHVTRDTLDPRPETEILVQEAISEPFRRVLDLGTGTGCILISCLLAQPEATGLGTDISEATLAVARENAVVNDLGARADFASGDWWRAVEGRFDLIVSNPPYIAEAELAGLAPEVREWEPRQALSPGGDGLGAYRAIAAGAAERLTPAGRLILEIGVDQAADVTALLGQAGFSSIRVIRDLEGRDRVISARMVNSA